MAYIPSSNSVVSYQSVPSSLLSGASIYGQLPAGTAMLGSVAAIVSNFPTNSSISGQVDVSILGVGLNNQADGVTAGVQLMTVGFGRVFNGTNWDRLRGNSSIGALVNTGAGSVILATGSIIGFQGGTTISSVISSTPSSMLTGASIFGQLPAGTAVLGSVTALQGTNPWIINTNGSVAAVIIGGSVATATTNSSVMLLNSANTIGSVSALVTFPTTQNISGSVVSFQGTNPWVIGSIVGTYAEDAASADGDKGLLVMGWRNDTIASTAGTDKDYTVFATDSSGRIINKPFVSEDGTIVSYASSVTSTSVTLIQASTIGKKTYVTDLFLSNTGATTTLVTLQDGSTSIIGQFIVPTGGGNNAPGIAIPLKTNTSQDLAWKSNSASSIVYLTLKGYQAP